ncbi:hypothetical protein JMJ35_004757 [Cladonia borealis]|uniref:Flavoprotein pyridine nucleotide cytochrome reductase-like FAD-binding domain-containing protein n=1 Tax=Cladonia borealis TaxID=184061 RepID=A0AA39R0T9_9LECA|nr:hypothetical protein JMJ35_004757 [Cladonia borealis]
MQSISWRRRCLQPSYLKGFLNNSQRDVLLGSRNFASRPPGFSASKPPSAKARPFKDRPAPVDGNKPSSGRHKSANESNTRETIYIEETLFTVARRWFRRRSVKVLVFSLSAYLGYTLYNWQTDPHRSLILNPRFFTPFIFEKRDKVSSSSCILNLKSVPAGQNADNINEAWETGVWSVLVMQPELQIARAYTPLPPRDGDEPEQLRLFVRQEPNGEVSTFLSTIYRGTLVHCRGPHIEYEIPADVDEILFIAGGTGIAPALQVAHTLFNYRTALPDQSPKLRILWANRRREDSYQGPVSNSSQHFPETGNSKFQSISAAWFGKPAPKPEETPATKPESTSNNDATNPLQPQTILVEELEALKSHHPDQLEIDYFVDEEDSYVTENILRRYLGSNNEEQSDHDLAARKKKVILISGPDGFVNYYAGPKYWRNGVEVQGPVEGVLRKIDPKGWEIWKL